MLSPEFLAIGGGSSSYRVLNSLRFRASNSAYLSRTSGASPTDQKKVTYSAWMKAAPTLSSGSQVALVCTTGNAGMIAWNISGYGGRLFTRADANDVQFAWLARDPSAWFHLVVTIDTTQATASDRIKAWLNGVALVYQSGTYPTLNSNTTLNPASTAMRLMSDIVNGTYLDGHLTHVHLIDGQALTPSSFGKTDAVTGEWVPKAYSGSYGTNGFRLAFEDAASTTTIGNDSSGNANNWTTSGISVTAGTTFDQSLDTPTLNYATFDAISPVGSASSIGTLAAANLTFNHSAANYAQRFGSFAVASGKWYFEYTITTLSSGSGLAFGIGKTADYPSGTGVPGSWTGCVGYGEFGDTYLRPITEAAGVSNTSGVASTDFLVNDIIMVAFDVGAGKFWMGKNGTWFDSGNPAAGTNEKQTFTANINWRPWCVTYGSSAAQNVVNFGQRAFAYSPPSGFSALNTANLAAPSIKRSRQYFDARLRTGTGAAASVSDLEFAPDLVWIKSRSAATTHNLFDTSRGAQKGIQSTGPNAEYTDANSLSAFASNGYSLGSDASSRGVNVSAATYVDWALKSGSTPGFNVTLYTGNGGGARNIAHGLGVAPQLMLVRGRDARAWAGWHKNLTSAAYYVDLGTVAAEAVDTTMFDSTAPDASNFRVGSFNNANLVNYLAYLFTEVPGFSRIGVYTGNNNTDGPFVWCGFKPKFVMVKARDAATGWFIANPSNSANEVIQRVFADGANAEGSNVYGLDLLAGGFKVRAPTGYSLNNSGISYLFIAFADVPFKYARAR
jgi:hypothetical protein